MNNFVFSTPFRKGLQGVLLLSMLLFSLGPGSASPAYAAPPTNDTFASATAITSIPFQNVISTTEANAAIDPTDPGQVATGGIPCEGRALGPGKRTVWYRYDATSSRGLHVDTIGSSYDTFIAVWRGTSLSNLTFVTCDDDIFSGYESEVLFAATTGNTYYIEVAGFAGTTNNPDQPNPGGTLQLHVTSFEDVPSTYWAWGYIEGLYGAGITTGCNTVPLLYCPTATVTRDQMAVFLLRGKHGRDYVPPPVGASTGFADVPANYWAGAWIKQLAAEGITGGCGGGNYCPGNPVTRDQMAVFLLKAKHGPSYLPPPATGKFFDVPIGYWAGTWIEQLATEGITSGCTTSPPNYCPLTPVTRDQMAVFLSRTFGITPLPGG